MGKRDLEEIQTLMEQADRREAQKMKTRLTRQQVPTNSQLVKVVEWDVFYFQ